MKKKSYLSLMVVIVLISSCSSPSHETKNPTSNPEFDVMLQEYYAQHLDFYPIEATFAGDDRFDSVLVNNLTMDYREKINTHYQYFLEELVNYDKASLSEEQKTSYEVLKWECEIGIEGSRFPSHQLPIDQFWTMQLTIGQFASGQSAQPFKTVADYQEWLNRLGVFTQWCDTAIFNMKQGMAAGVVLPKSLVVKVIPQLKAWESGPAEDHHFYSPVQSIPESFTQEEIAAIKQEYSSVIEDGIIPAIKRLLNFMETEYLSAARVTTGYGDLPDGSDWYQHQIKKYTTTSMTADEIFNLGKSEVARLRSEMEKVKVEVGFEGDLKAFFDHVRSKKELMPFDDPQQVIDNFKKIHEKMKPNLAKLFDKTPKTAFEVRRTEAFREASASAEYNPGSLDGTRPGIFYVPIRDVNTYNYFSDEDLFLHEAIPGHHYQISLAQENLELPDFRRILWYSAYGEGWALYSESMGKELGLYEDPYQYFGMLSAEMHRAIRLVVDAGMHAKGWTREQAIQYSLDNEAESEDKITSEIERYMANPGQALSYKVGQLKIRELRNNASSQLGDQFDIKVFHNKVLESGCVPLKVLEDKINAWIEMTKGA